MKIIFKRFAKFNEIDTDTQNYLIKNLTLGYYGLMRGNAKIHNPVTIIAYHGETPVGWAIRVPGLNSKVEINVFVGKDYRRMGIGTKLINKIKTKTSHGVIWDIQSGNFYKTLEEKIPLTYY
jgi:GNAT superfamily N-acetyltransferase